MIEDRRQEKGTTEDEMVGWNHRLDGHEFEQTLGDSEGQGGLAYCSSWGHKELDMSWRLNNNTTKCGKGVGVSFPVSQRPGGGPLMLRPGHGGVKSV